MKRKRSFAGTGAIPALSIAVLAGILCWLCPGAYAQNNPPVPPPPAASETAGGPDMPPPPGPPPASQDEFGAGAPPPPPGPGYWQGYGRAARHGRMDGGYGPQGRDALGSPRWGQGQCSGPQAGFGPRGPRPGPRYGWNQDQQGVGDSGAGPMALGPRRGRGPLADPDTRFKLIDTNGDNMISREEFRAFHNLRAARAPLGPPQGEPAPVPPPGGPVGPPPQPPAAPAGPPPQPDQG